MRNSFFVLAACAALNFAAIGCGSDSKNPTPDSGTDSGIAGQGGGGGEGGASGNGGTLTVQECTDMSVANTATASCAGCVCAMATAAASTCAKNADCWKLITCIGAHCPDDPTTCAGTPECSPFALGGGADATMLTQALTVTCASSCQPTAMTDGGTDDGGDAGN